MGTTRRDFLIKTAVAGAGISMAPNVVFSQSAFSSKGKLKIGFIGVGLRGATHLNNAINRDDTEITAICDIDPDRIAVSLKMIDKGGRKKPKVFDKGEEDYLNLLA